MSTMTEERWMHLDMVLTRKPRTVPWTKLELELHKYAKELRQQLVNADVAMEVARRAYSQAAQDECAKLRKENERLRLEFEGINCEHRAKVLADLKKENKELREGRHFTKDGVEIRPCMRVYAFEPTGGLMGYDVSWYVQDSSSCPSRAYIMWKTSYSTEKAAWADKESQRQEPPKTSPVG